MLKNVSVLEDKINNFINSNLNLNCIDLSLLKGIKENNFYIISSAIAAGANVYLELEAGNELLDMVINYIEDQDITTLFMNVLLEDAIRKNNHDDILFAINHGADIKIIENSDFANGDIQLNGAHNEAIEF